MPNESCLQLTDAPVIQQPDAEPESPPLIFGVLILIGMILVLVSLLCLLSAAGPGSIAGAAAQV